MQARPTILTKLNDYKFFLDYIPSKFGNHWYSVLKMNGSGPGGSNDSLTVK